MSDVLNNLLGGLTLEERHKIFRELQVASERYLSILQVIDDQEKKVRFFRRGLEDLERKINATENDSDKAELLSEKQNAEEELQRTEIHLNSLKKECNSVPE